MSDLYKTPQVSPRAINPALKLALELGPLALFFLANWKYGYYGATIVLMVGVALAVSYAALRRIPVMPLVTAAVVAIFGGLTLFFQDQTLLQIKPTFLYLLFGGALLAGFAFGKPLLPVMFDGALNLTPKGWRILTWRWIVFFFALAALNEYIRHFFSYDFWVGFKAFGFLPLTLVFAVAQTPVILRHDAGGTDGPQAF
jgi:intracellular septation protein